MGTLKVNVAPVLGNLISGAVKSLLHPFITYMPTYSCLDAGHLWNICRIYLCVPGQNLKRAFTSLL